MILLSTGSPRVPGDEEEEDTDDLENEFNFELSNQEKEHVDAMLHGHMSYGGTYDHDLPHHMMHQQPRFPLLTNGQMVSNGLPNFLQIVQFRVSLRLHGLNHVVAAFLNTRPRTLGSVSRGISA